MTLTAGGRYTSGRGSSLNLNVCSLKQNCGCSRVKGKVKLNQAEGEALTALTQISASLKQLDILAENIYRRIEHLDEKSKLYVLIQIISLIDGFKIKLINKVLGGAR